MSKVSNAPKTFDDEAAKLDRSEGSFRRDKLPDMRELVAEFRAGDGIDPRYDRRRLDAGDNKSNFSALRLAGQIEQAVGTALATAKDDNLRAMSVVEASANSNGSCFVIKVGCEDPGWHYDSAEISAALTKASGYIRSQVAQTITRKFTPQLAFEVLPCNAGNE